MEHYPAETERRMRVLFQSLSEKDRRRYAAVEADKLGHGGTDSIAALFRVDPKTIRQGRVDHAEFLELVLQDELAVQYERMIERRTRAACFRDQKERLAGKVSSSNSFLLGL